MTDYLYDAYGVQMHGEGCGYSDGGHSRRYVVQSLNYSRIYLKNNVTTSDNFLPLHMKSAQFNSQCFVDECFHFIPFRKS